MINDKFIEEQTKKIKGYLTQVYYGKITRQQFLGYMMDILDLLEMEKRQNVDLSEQP